MLRLISTLIIMILLSAPAAHAVTFKMATLAPNGSGWMDEIEKAAEEINKQTQGRVNFKFYTGGVMGNAKSVLKKIRINQLQGGAFTGGELADIYPDIQIYSLPFLFRSYAEVDYVRSKMDSLLRDGMQQHGMILLGTSDGGFAYIMSDTPIKSIDELHDKKIWMPEGDKIMQTVFETLGISPIPLSIADVYTGLQTGMIDTIGSSAIGAVAFQWHTRIKYISDIPLVYLTGHLVLDKKAFDKISKADQAIVQNVMLATMTRLGKINRRNDEQARLALQKQGIQFVPVSKAEWQRSQEIAKQAIDKLGKEGLFTNKMYNLLQTNLNAYRQQHSASANAKP